jgi:hypothetical protein
LKTINDIKTKLRESFSTLTDSIWNNIVDSKLSKYRNLLHSDSDINEMFIEWVHARKSIQETLPEIYERYHDMINEYHSMFTENLVKTFPMKE